MIRMRIQVEEMHVYYFIAKKLINSAKLGFMGIMASSEERLLNHIYNSWDLDEINDLSKKLFDKLDKAETELKLNANSQGLKDVETLISEAVSYTSNLLFKPEVLEHVKKGLKVDLSTHDKIILCVENICQAKRVLMGLSPEDRKNVLNGTGIEVKNESQEEKHVVTAVDEENVSNVTEVEVSVKVPDIDVSEMPMDESVVEAMDEDVDERNKLRNVFTAEDVPVEPFEHYVNGMDLIKKSNSIDDRLEELKEEAEVLDFDDDVEEEHSVEVADSVEKVLDLSEEIINTDEVDDTNEIIVNENSEQVIDENLGVSQEENMHNNQIINEENIDIEEKSDELKIEDSSLEKNMSEEDIIVVMDKIQQVINTFDEVRVEEKNNSYFDIPQIVKIIERDGNVVDEDVIVDHN